jgi:hypothetical protein
LRESEEIMITNLLAGSSDDERDWAFHLHVWKTALFLPKVEAYERLLCEKHATARTAYSWVFSAAFAAGLIATQVNRQSNTGWFWNAGGMPLAVLEVVVFAVTTGILFGLARLFGGTGSYAHFAYISAAITAPLYVAMTLLGLLLPMGNFRMLLWIMPFSIYASVLSVIAVKAVHKFSWTRAMLTVVLPGLFVNCADIMIFGGFLSSIGPTIVMVWPAP